MWPNGPYATRRRQRPSLWHAKQEACIHNALSAASLSAFSSPPGASVDGGHSSMSSSPTMQWGHSSITALGRHRAGLGDQVLVGSGPNSGQLRANFPSEPADSCGWTCLSASPAGLLSSSTTTLRVTRMLGIEEGGDRVLMTMDHGMANAHMRAHPRTSQPYVATPGHHLGRQRDHGWHTGGTAGTPPGTHARTPAGPWGHGGDTSRNTSGPRAGHPWSRPGHPPRCHRDRNRGSEAPVTRPAQASPPLENTHAAVTHDVRIWCDFPVGGAIKHTHSPNLRPPTRGPPPTRMRARLFHHSARLDLGTWGGDRNWDPCRLRSPSGAGTTCRAPRSAVDRLSKRRKERQLARFFSMVAHRGGRKGSTQVASANTDQARNPGAAAL